MVRKLSRWLWLCVGIALGCDPANTDRPRPPSPCDPLRGTAPDRNLLSPFSIVVLPDTQFYAERYPDTFYSQVDWIAAERDRLGLAFMLHEGDIVNDNVPAQWNVASQALHSLDNALPYLLAVGNHDLRLNGNRLTRDADLFHENFPAAMYDDRSWFCGSFERDDLQNTYALMEAGGTRWLVLALEFGPRDGVLQWANDILSDYYRYPAIIVTHSYMYLGAERYDHIGLPEQRYSPHHYGLTGSVNDGEQMWNALVEPNPNVQLVLSGHMLWPGVGRLSSSRADGSTTHQLLANYQACPSATPCTDPITGATIEGGDGFLRILDVNDTHRALHVRTYSTTRDIDRTDADNDFHLTLTPP